MKTASIDDAELKVALLGPSCSASIVRSLATRFDATAELEKYWWPPTLPKSGRSSKQVNQPRGSKAAPSGNRPARRGSERSPEWSRRKRLATEVFNAGLTYLAGAFSSSQCTEPSGQSPTRGPHGCQAASTCSPLGERPDNRRTLTSVGKEKAESSHAFKGYHKVYNGAVGICLALQELRHQESTIKDGVSRSMLDEATCALAGKLVSLGFGDLALRTLHLLFTTSQRITSSSGYNIDRVRVASPQPSIVSMLNVKISSLSLICTLEAQSLVLRILVQRKSANDILKILKSFDVLDHAALLSTENFALLQKAPDQHLRAARCLTTLGRLYTSISRTLVSAGPTNKPTEAPYEALSILALVQAQKLAATETGFPLARALHCARSQKEQQSPDSNTHNCLTKPLYRNILEHLRNASVSVSPAKDAAELHSEACLFLVDCGESFMDVRSSISLLKKALDRAASCSISDALQCVLLGNLGLRKAIMLEGDAEPLTIPHELMEMLPKVRQGLQGRRRHWTLLKVTLCDIASFYRSALVSRVQIEGRSDDSTRMHQAAELVTTCSSSLLQFEINGNTEMQRSASPPATSTSHIDPVIMERKILDPLLCLAQFPQTLDRCMDVFDRVIRKSLILLKHSEASLGADAGSRSKATYSHLIVRISDAYWSIYIHYKNSRKPLHNIMVCVRKSVDALLSSSRLEDLPGQWTLRLQKLTELSCTVQSRAEATQSNVAILRTLAEHGALTKLATEYSKSCFGHMAASNGLHGAFIRILTAEIQNQIQKVQPTKELMTQLEELRSVDETCALRHCYARVLVNIDVPLSMQSWIEQEIKTSYRLVAAVYRINGSHFQEMQLRNAVHRYSLDRHLVSSLGTGPVPEMSQTGSDDTEDDARKAMLVSSHLSLELLWQRRTDESGIAMVLQSISTLLSFLQDIEMHQQKQMQPLLQDLLVDLTNLAKYLSMLGLVDQLAQVLQSLLELHKARVPAAALPDEWLMLLAELAVRGNLLGIDATRLCRKATVQSANESEGLLAAARHLAAWAQCEYQEQYETGQEHLRCLQSMFNDSSKINAFDRQSLSSIQRLRLQIACSQASSIVASRNAKIGHAMYFERQALKIGMKAWATLERQALQDTKISTSALQYSDDLAASSGRDDNAFASANRIRLWALVPQILESCLRLASLACSAGLRTEAQYYLVQAQSIAEASAAPAQIVQVQTQYAILDTAIGNASQAVVRLQCLTPDPPVSSVAFDYHCTIAQARIFSTDWFMASESVNRAARILQDADSLEATAMTEKLERLSLKNSAPACKQASRKVQLIKPSHIKLGSELEVQLNCTARMAAIRRNRIAQLRATILTQQQRLEEAQDELLRSRSVKEPVEVSARRALSVAQVQLQRALSDIDLDPVLSLLSESVISDPTIAQPHCSKDQPCEDSITRKAKTERSQAPSRKRNEPEKPFGSPHVSGLTQVDAVQPNEISQLKISEIHQYAEMKIKLQATISALSSSRFSGQSKLRAGSMAQSQELAKNAAHGRAAASIEVDRLLQEGAAGFDLPALVDSAVGSESRSLHANHSKDIPPGWDVLSMTIGETREQLYITRLRADEAPFSLAIPLGRSGHHETENDPFTFARGRDELTEIIESANASTGLIGDPTRKGFKSEWWDNRARLDGQLRDLILNMEKIWFGGFRGIFSPVRPMAEDLERFGHTFQIILDRHLPSRKQGRRCKAVSTPIYLAPQIYSLFFGLGDSENADLDELLLDLLYFVVDILQFSGERNAYDEIDFDLMLIEVRDALVQFSAAAQRQDSRSTEDHLILILDKALHRFPWESMPVLRGRSVSRLTSTAALQDRLSMMRSTVNSMTDEKRNSGLQALADDGVFILNPSGDLSSTEETFESHFRGLAGWQGIVNHPPKEEELIDNLSTRSLYCYFGHGSGGQYIRSRAVRRLKTCAVALLMGCSSSVMTEAGTLESHGTPLNYLHAGAPAVVGTLWDVTDKDIDRFSMQLLQDWGLLDRPRPQSDSASRSQATDQVGHSPRKRAVRPKTRAAKPSSHSPTPVPSCTSDNQSCLGLTLDAAVARARDACVLKYLNGAAPVIYGIPVSLVKRS